MRRVDVWLQGWRAAKARPWVPMGARLLDVGCHQGEFLEGLGDRIGPSVGIDPLAEPRATPRYRLIRGTFPGSHSFPDGSFDVVSMLAVIEHVPDWRGLVAACWRVLAPEGRVVLTVPSPEVDKILAVLLKLGIATGMSLEEHHGLDPADLPHGFRAQGFALERWQRFQLGLNNLMVFRRKAFPSSDRPAWVR